jgi:predicted nucleotidyltransferase
MDKNEAITKVKEYKALLQNFFTIDKIYLYGSYAKGTNNTHSDIDVAIVVNHLDGDYFTTTPLLWKLRRQIDDRIEPVIFEKGIDQSGFLAEIKKYGIEIV